MVLLSVRPPHVDHLLDGSKKVELRRRKWRVPDGTTVLVYASGRRRALVGSFVVHQTEVGTSSEIWAKYGAESALNRAEFDEYFDGAKQAVAIVPAEIRQLDFPVTLGELRRRYPSFVVPQSFRYVRPTELTQILNGEFGPLMQCQKLQSSD